MCHAIHPILLVPIQLLRSCLNAYQPVIYYHTVVCVTAVAKYYRNSNE